LQSLELYEAVLNERPDDDRNRSRMDSVRALLQPSEMVSRRRTEPEEPDQGDALEELSDAEQGEMHASSGRFEEAVRCYQRALEKAPRNELLRERFEELRRLSPPVSLARHDGLERAEKLDPFTPPGVPKLTMPPPAPKPAVPKPRELPRDPIAFLQALLERVRGSRRRPLAGA
jgi:tetratricopeptide (TPR) repeat protein